METRLKRPPSIERPAIKLHPAVPVPRRWILYPDPQCFVLAPEPPLDTGYSRPLPNSLQDGANKTVSAATYNDTTYKNVSRIKIDWLNDWSIHSFSFTQFYIFPFIQLVRTLVTQLQSITWDTHPRIPCLDHQSFFKRKNRSVGQTSFSISPPPPPPTPTPLPCAILLVRKSIAEQSPNIANISRIPHKRQSVPVCPDCN